MTLRRLNRAAIPVAAAALSAFLLAGPSISLSQPQLAPWALAAGPGSELPTEALLSVEVLPFTAMPSSASEVRDAEGRYQAYLLRQLLEESTQWGPVRMLADASAGAELVVRGEIQRATPQQLALAIQATDATGKVWLDQVYQQTADAENYAGGQEPFLGLFRRVAGDLTAVRNSLSLGALSNILTVATLRRAGTFAPDAFGNYLTETEGIYQVNRLPAEGDPLFAQLDRIAEAQALFADAVDPNFERFFKDIQPTYILWRKTLLESDALMSTYREKSARKSSRDKSARAIYRELRELKLYQQTVRETMESFVFRMEPTKLETQGQVVELGGTLAEQTAQWQDILNRMFAAEVGL